jgi:hypothetical protein
MRFGRATMAAGALGVGLTCALGVARAELTQEAPTFVPPPPQLEGFANVDARVAWFPRMPTLRTTFPKDFDGTPHEGQSGELPSSGHGQFAAVGAEVAIAIDRHWGLPLVGVALGGAVGGYPSVVTSVDGVPMTLKPWSAGYVYMQGLGLEYRARARRWMFEAGVRGGVSIVWMKTSIAVGGDEYAGSGVAISPTLKGDLAVCRRLDPTQRACLFVAPSIYEFGLLNGASLGLRWEVGS